jgi:hypothetical protein
MKGGSRDSQRCLLLLAADGGEQLLREQGAESEGISSVLYQRAAIQVEERHDLLYPTHLIIFKSCLITHLI